MLKYIPFKVVLENYNSNIMEIEMRQTKGFVKAILNVDGLR
jgi:hypothetical protein